MVGVIDHGLSATRTKETVRGRITTGKSAWQLKWRRSRVGLRNASPLYGAAWVKFPPSRVSARHPARFAVSHCTVESQLLENCRLSRRSDDPPRTDRKSTRLNSSHRCI